MELPAIRFDNLEIRKPEITPEGYLRADAIFGREGILEYRNPVTGAVRRELRTPEANQKALAKFGHKPVTVEHPPVLLDKHNASQYTKGWTDEAVSYLPGGLIKGGITVFDAEAIDLIRSGEKAEISAGYRCNVVHKSGIWQGQHYDAEQTDVEVNHVCVTRKGRAGAEVRVILDSADDSNSSLDIGFQVNYDSLQTMSTSINRYGLTFANVPPELAIFATEKFDQLDDLSTYTEKLEDAARTDSETIQNLTAQISEIEADRDNHLERNDELEEMLFNADSVLESLGYKRDSMGEYIRKDGKKPAFLEEIDEEEDDEEEDEDAEEMPAKGSKKGKKDGKKDCKGDCDKCKANMDSELADRLAAWMGADKLVPGIVKSDKFDSTLTTTGIQKLVIAELRPEKAEKLDSMDAGTIGGYYEFLTEQSGNFPAPSRQTESHADSLENMASRTRRGSQSQQTESAIDLDAWQKPLTLTR